MIEFPVVSVLGEGVVELATLERLTPDDKEDNQIVCAESSPEVMEQMVIARQIANHFLTRPYIRPLAAHTFEKGNLILRLGGTQAYKGRSFGLSFLTACLALGLGVSLRKGRLFSAALSQALVGRGLPGGGFRLDPVIGIGQKMAAVCLNRKDRLYLRCEKETTLLKFERAFWRGDPQNPCLPFVLPQVLSTAAVAVLALEVHDLLDRVKNRSDATGFLLLALRGIGEVWDDENFPRGLGKAMAFCRSRGVLEDMPFAKEIGEDLGFSGLASGELMASLLLGRILEAPWTEEIGKELLKGFISRNPGLALYPETPESVPERAPCSTDLDLWLQRPPPDHPVALAAFLDILSICAELVPEMAGYWPPAKSLVLKSLATFLSKAVEMTASGQAANSARLLEMLYGLNVSGRIAKVQTEWVPEAVDLAVRCVAEIRKLDAEKVEEIAAKIHRSLMPYRLPEVLRPLVKEDAAYLAFTFRVACSPGSGQGPQPVGPRPDLERVNDLDLIITGPRAMHLLVPSPILLMESSLRQHHGYCQRKGMTLADDTSSRYPINDTKTVWGSFFEGSHSVRIGFAVSPGNVAAVQWVDSVAPWPPAIDSQFLVASMVEDPQTTNPVRILDIGSGTGYLAIAAAHRWSSIQQIHLLDIDPVAVAVAITNIKNDPVAERIKVTTEARDFRRFQGGGFDLLLCAPPYLPDRPAPAASRIDLATNGTALLEEVVRRGADIAKEVWMVFSALAWPEFQRAMAAAPNKYEKVEVLRMEFAPLRLPWLEPIPPEDKSDLHAQRRFEERRQYYSQVLGPRGLIDMDNHASWPAYTRDFAASLPDTCGTELMCEIDTEALEKKLDSIEKQSRGYRFWHEIRVVRMMTRC